MSRAKRNSVIFVSVFLFVMFSLPFWGCCVKNSFVKEKSGVLQAGWNIVCHTNIPDKVLIEAREVVKLANDKKWLEGRPPIKLEEYIISHRVSEGRDGKLNTYRFSCSRIEGMGFPEHFMIIVHSDGRIHVGLGR